MDFKAIYAVVEDDFAAVNQFINHHLDSNVPLIREVGDYIVQSGGKRLRPLVSILCARASGYHGERHVDVAAIIEFLHTATLLHDDVVDGSDLRRGKKTANAKFLVVKLNGKILHENVEMKGPTPSGVTGKEAATGPIMFQGDHGPVAFRNINITPLKK